MVIYIYNIKICRKITQISTEARERKEYRDGPQVIAINGII
jgi:hypothetical protein